MPAYSANFTSRYRIRYSSIGKTHTMTFRYIGGAAPAEGMKDGVVAWLDTLAPLRFTDWSLLAEEYSLAGTDFFLPLLASAAPVAGTVAIPGGFNAWVPHNINFQALSAQAGRASWFLYGVAAAPTGAEDTQNDYRVTGAEAAIIATAAGNLAAIPGLVANDGQAIIVVRPYANVNINSYYQRKARG